MRGRIGQQLCTAVSDITWTSGESREQRVWRDEALFPGNGLCKLAPLLGGGRVQEIGAVTIEAGVRLWCREVELSDLSLLRCQRCTLKRSNKSKSQERK